jgi:hypothetical protein
MQRADKVHHHDRSKSRFFYCVIFVQVGAHIQCHYGPSVNAARPRPWRHKSGNDVQKLQNKRPNMAKQIASASAIATAASRVRTERMRIAELAYSPA